MIGPAIRLQITQISSSNVKLLKKTTPPSPSRYQKLSLPRRRKAPKERTGTALVSALHGDQHDVITDGHAVAIDAMPSPGSLGLPEGQNCSSHEASSTAPVADETGLQGSASGMKAGVSDPESANKLLADLTRKCSKLQDLHTQANSTIQGLRKKVKKLEGNIETFGKNMKFLNEDQIRPLSRDSNKRSPRTVKQAPQN
ncbi:hypothetical protein HPB48_026488 [Haemaphysalis longicornis]|uniref:Uncharacterized protein n=1 Tax=Haemaphysalis longicornis TaxID=44386 RepID=A0A9J6HC87_HAELO|nr:hypothetical protein HPB48_026488 [Haemaphysalis longicornis]